MNGSLVSAVITTHNRLDFLKGAIDSVRNQTYENIEIIVVDDASDDGTREFFSKDCPLDVNYIYIEKEDSKGGNYARNLGLKNTKGDFVAFLDDDDEWLPTKIEKQMEVITGDPEIGFVGCGMIHEYDSGNCYYPETKDLPEGDLHEYILYNMPYLTSTFLARKEVLEKAGLFDENLKCWQDYEFEIRIMQTTKVGTVKENLLKYRVFRQDKNRLTNKLDIWVEAVSYINKKHAGLIENASDYAKKQRQRMIAMDGAFRSENCGDNKRKRRYLMEWLKIEPSIKNLIRCIVNVYSFRTLRLNR